MLLLLPGCATAPQLSPDPLDALPIDFSIDATTLTGAAIPRSPEAHLRSSRSVLFADGSLHYGSDPDLGTGWLPPRARTLSREQVADVWALARELGLTNPAFAEPPVNFKLVEPAPNDIMYVVSITGDGDRWSYIRSFRLDEEPDPALAPMMRRLARLAWATDLPEAGVRVIPRRYDFGPDPYARYRQP